ncbi:UUP1 family membrane protein, partial [Marinobacter salarius]
MSSRSRIPFFFAILLLIAAGISIATWRHVELGIPWFTGEQKPVWMVEARVDFDGTGEPVLASLNIPDQPP